MSQLSIGFCVPFKNAVMEECAYREDRLNYYIACLTIRRCAEAIQLLCWHLFQLGCWGDSLDKKLSCIGFCSNKVRYILWSMQTNIWKNTNNITATSGIKPKLTKSLYSSFCHNKGVHQLGCQSCVMAASPSSYGQTGGQRTTCALSLRHHWDRNQSSAVG